MNPGGTNEKFDRAHFKGFGVKSLDFVVVYILNTGDYNIYMDVQQKINLGIMAELQSLDVGFALPIMALDFSRVAAMGDSEKQRVNQVFMGEDSPPRPATH